MDNSIPTRLQRRPRLQATSGQTTDNPIQEKIQTAANDPSAHSEMDNTHYTSARPSNQCHWMNAFKQFTSSNYASTALVRNTTPPIPPTHLDARNVDNDITRHFMEPTPIWKEPRQQSNDDKRQTTNTDANYKCNIILDIQHRQQ